MLMRTAMIILAAALAGCSMGTDVKRANDSIAQFHRLFNAGDYAAIQASAGPELKDDPRMGSIYDLMNRKLGKFVSSQQTGFNDSINTAGHILTVGQVTKFANGTGDETFTFRLGSDGKPALVGYNVNSPLLYDLRPVPVITPTAAVPHQAR
jgi:hypothetical protein